MASDGHMNDHTPMFGKSHAEIRGSFAKAAQPDPHSGQYADFRAAAANEFRNAMASAPKVFSKGPVPAPSSPYRSIPRKTK